MVMIVTKKQRKEMPAGEKTPNAKTKTKLLQISNVDYGLCVHLSYSPPPIPPIRSDSDEERNEHRLIHLFYVQALQATCVCVCVCVCVTRVYVFPCVV